MGRHKGPKAVCTVHGKRLSVNRPHSAILINPAGNIPKANHPDGYQAIYGKNQKALSALFHPASRKAGPWLCQAGIFFRFSV